MKLEEIRKLCDELGPLSVRADHVSGADAGVALYEIVTAEGVVADLLAKKYADLFVQLPKLLAVAQAAQELLAVKRSEAPETSHLWQDLRDGIAALESE